MNSPVDAQLEHALLVVLIQSVVIVGAARVFGVIFRRLGQPQVCGEIAAGLILGPRSSAVFFPACSSRCFSPPPDSSSAS